MAIFYNKKVVARYHFFAGIFVLVGIVLLGCIVNTMFIRRAHWNKVAERLIVDSIVVKPNRGNIYSADGQLLATSLPEYRLFMDYKIWEKDSLRLVRLTHERDSAFDHDLDSLCLGLSHILKDKSKQWFKERLLEGKKQGSSHWRIYPGRVSYLSYNEICKLPYFRLGTFKSGFHTEQYKECKKPFGSLASRIIGDLYPGKDSATGGLQLAYDSVLRGIPGLKHREKLGGRYVPLVDIPATNGADIQTTIDVHMQDFCEKAIVDKLKEINGQVGVVILMEVKTGDVKAIVNMTRCSDGEYREVMHNAVSNLMEPGSVFKPMSFMVAFNDGKLRMNETVDTGNGVKLMYGRKMRDHNASRGGYHVLNVPDCLGYSSNIGVSVLIDRIYHNRPWDFVEGIYKIGVAEDLKLDIPGYARPRIRKPKKDLSNWSKTALAWMSIGYETQIPPISVLNFYNGVANNGRMMRPRFVTRAMRDGEVIAEYPPRVVREQMCSPEALHNIQQCLRHVVANGLGGRAGSKLFSVSGKTGTAQVWGRNGFSHDYLISFAGYFPSEAPLYSCIVCIQKHGMPASGGTQCGPVFKAVAEMAMVSANTPDLREATDTVHSHMPRVHAGNMLYANNALKELNFDVQADWSRADRSNSTWGRANEGRDKVHLEMATIDRQRVPDVRGTGARDAVYLLERLGLHVVLHGKGIVTKQSLPPTHLIKKGETIVLELGLPRKDYTKTTNTNTQAL